MQRSKRRHYSITSSVRASSVGGTSTPNALAVLRLGTSSKFRGRLSGKVARRCTAQYSINLRCRFPKHLIDVPRENFAARR